MSSARLSPHGNRKHIYRSISLRTSIFNAGEFTFLFFLILHRLCALQNSHNILRHMHRLLFRIHVLRTLYICNIAHSPDVSRALDSQELIDLDEARRVDEAVGQVRGVRHEAQGREVEVGGDLLAAGQREFCAAVGQLGIAQHLARCLDGYF